MNDLKLPNLDANINIIARECIDVIKARTGQGLDKDGRPFKPYSKMTIQKKGTTKVTLEDTGRMLNALDYRQTSPYSFSISIDGVPYSDKVLSERPILGFTENELQSITQMLSDELMKGSKK